MNGQWVTGSGDNSVLSSSLDAGTDPCVRLRLQPRSFPLSVPALAAPPSVRAGVRGQVGPGTVHSVPFGKYLN